MIFEIALGVALGLFIFANWRGLLALSTMVALFLLLLVLAGVALWGLYSGVQVVRALPPLLEPNSLTSIVVATIFSVLIQIMFAFALGSIIESRLRLAPRESYVLGGVFYVLFILSAITLGLAVEEQLSLETSTATTLFLSVQIAAWGVAIQQCVRRARARARARVRQAKIDEKGSSTFAPVCTGPGIPADNCDTSDS